MSSNGNSRVICLRSRALTACFAFVENALRVRYKINFINCCAVVGKLLTAKSLNSLSWHRIDYPIGHYSNFPKALDLNAISSRFSDSLLFSWALARSRIRSIQQKNFPRRLHREILTRRPWKVISAPQKSVDCITQTRTYKKRFCFVLTTRTFSPAGCYRSTTHISNEASTRGGNKKRGNEERSKSESDSFKVKLGS